MTVVPTPRTERREGSSRRLPTLASRLVRREEDRAAANPVEVGDLHSGSGQTDRDSKNSNLAPFRI
jgi:hypothetical protein